MREIGQEKGQAAGREGQVTGRGKKGALEGWQHVVDATQPPDLAGKVNQSMPACLEFFQSPTALSSLFQT